mgnify:CR=1 FL=1
MVDGNKKVVELVGIGGKYFFFQAEDGIRDKLVTGVQTCALPIFYNLIFSFYLISKMRKINKNRNTIE